MLDLVGAITDTAVSARPAASAQAWFAGGERIGYDPKARAIVAAQDAPLRIFLRQEGELAHAVSFLPGFPDGSFGWAKVQPHLPNAAEMPKLFIEYVKPPRLKAPEGGALCPGSALARHVAGTRCANPAKAARHQPLRWAAALISAIASRASTSARSLRW